MKHKIIMTIFLAASSAADQHSSLRNFHNGYKENNSIYGSHPSTARFVAEHTAINVAQIIAIWKTKGKLHKIAVAGVAEEIAEESKDAAQNYKGAK